MRLCRLAAGVLCAAFCAAQANAADRNPAAHVHGVSELNLAIDGKSVEAELISPGADIVGFEGRPDTKAERAAVTRAAAILRNGPAILGLPQAAQCSFTETEVESALIDQAAETHDDHGHKDEHKHGHKDEHKHEHGKETHAEFHVHYHLQCAAPDRIDHIEFRAFQQFPNMEEVEVQAITPGGQRAAELTPKSPRLDF